MISPGLFLKCLYVWFGVMREINVRNFEKGTQMTGETGEKWKMSQLLYADDKPLVAGSEDHFRDWWWNLENCVKGTN